ncbi:mannonate dehydratase [Roseivivax sp. GX 12232]|uniref:mannonate dehydratase n=1 Tax=Roseivivax sp. GX 12232 TaxID=2900547 RepID=UPI001E42888E|nr:mannonate dehydratase [Roseivivax sp. GX 12232]MCE0504114.1 mannonate dehydratase [Roseivivax sp. GX 12232]
MKHCWRWFGPEDPVSLADIAQAGATGVVTALHDLPPGAVWTSEAIEARLAEIAQAPLPLTWDVVESLPVSEDIKRRSGPYRSHIANWIESLSNLAAAGVRVVCYNFMPVLDWTRTDVAHRLPHGGTAMRFDLVDFAAFDLFVLERAGAAGDYPADLREAARLRAEALDVDQRMALARTAAAGLPGAAATMSLADIRGYLDAYRGVTPEALRNNLAAFIAEVAPAAEALGLRLCAHPDDPPWPLLGLPRILSTAEDYAALLGMAETTANGITLCSGSLGARGDNDLAAMMRRFGPRVHFLHLRNVRREGTGVPCSFHEAAHLDGSTDMVALAAAVLEEEKRRAAEGREDAQIPMRPDHGQALMTDLHRPMRPGYPAVGRLRGLAELRGVEATLGWRGVA